MGIKKAETIVYISVSPLPANIDDMKDQIITAVNNMDRDILSAFTRNSPIGSMLSMLPVVAH